jgi:multiple sugar transport system substrate-binding protein
MNRRKTKNIVAAALAGLTAIAVVGCGSPGTTPAVSDASKTPTTITVWTFSKLASDVAAMQEAIDGLQKANPWLTVNLVLNKHDADFTAAVTAGNAPDVFIASGADNVAKFCDNGAVVDMAPLAKQIGFDLTATYPSSVLGYTAYKGAQCALPLLTDGYALFYNKDMFQAAGVSTPPKTLTELTEVAKKLTVKNADGTIKTWGLLPPTVTYAQNQNWFVGGHTGAQFYNSDGKAAFASDATWKEDLTWQKNLLDFYGMDNVTKFVAKYSSHEDDASNPFETGAAAMEFAGEWHIGEMTTNAPKVNYGTAAIPVPDSKASIYGAGTANGTVVYLSSDSKNQAAAFLAVKQLTSDTDFLTTYASQASNIPTTFESLKSWKPENADKWKAFTDMLSSPNSYYKTLTPAGAEDLNAWTSFITDWENGKVTDLSSGLARISQQIDGLNG